MRGDPQIGIGDAGDDADEAVFGEGAGGPSVCLVVQEPVAGEGVVLVGGVHQGDEDVDVEETDHCGRLFLFQEAADEFGGDGNGVGTVGPDGDSVFEFDGGCVVRGEAFAGEFGDGAAEALGFAAGECAGGLDHVIINL